MFKDFGNSPNVYIYDSSTRLVIFVASPSRTWTETSSRHCVYNRISGPVSTSSSGRVGGGDPPLQACRDSAGTPRTRVRLEPAIDKTCRPRRLQSEMSGFDLCLPPQTR